MSNKTFFSDIRRATKPQSHSSAPQRRGRPKIEGKNQLAATQEIQEFLRAEIRELLTHAEEDYRIIEYSQELLTKIGSCFLLGNLHDEVAKESEFRDHIDVRMVYENDDDIALSQTIVFRLSVPEHEREQMMLQAMGYDYDLEPGIVRFKV